MTAYASLYTDPLPTSYKLCLFASVKTAGERLLKPNTPPLIRMYRAIELGLVSPEPPG